MEKIFLILVLSTGYWKEITAGNVDSASTPKFTQQIEMYFDETIYQEENTTSNETFMNLVFPITTDSPKTEEFMANIQISNLKDTCVLGNTTKKPIRISHESCTVEQNNHSEDQNVNLILHQLQNFCNLNRNLGNVKTLNTTERCVLIYNNEKRYVIDTNLRSTEADSPRTCGKLFENLKNNIRWDIHYGSEETNTCGSTSCCQENPVVILSNTEIYSWLSENELWNFITTFFYFLSLFCLSLIFITAISSRSYRGERSNQILIHFAFSIFSQTILLVTSCRINVHVCYYHNILYLYFALAESCWTSIISYLQYKRYVKVFDSEPNFLILKSLAYCYPVIPVLLHMILNSPTKSLSWCLIFGIPKLTTFIINTVILTLIIKSFVHINREHVDFKRSLSMEVKLIFFLLLVLDFGWLNFIPLYFTSNFFFVYLFLATQSMQGFMLFFVFGIMNKHNRQVYKKFIAASCNRISR